MSYRREMFKELQKKRVLILKLGPRQTVVSIISEFSLKGPEDPLWLLLKGEHSRWRKRQKQARNEEPERVERHGSSSARVRHIVLTQFRLKQLLL